MLGHIAACNNDAVASPHQQSSHGTFQISVDVDRKAGTQMMSDTRWMTLLQESQLESLRCTFTEAFEQASTRQQDGDLLDLVFRMMWRHHTQDLVDAIPIDAKPMVVQRLSEHPMDWPTEQPKLTSAPAVTSKMHTVSKAEVLPSATEMAKQLLDDRQVPIAVRAIVATAAVADIGPKEILRQQFQTQVEDLQEVLKMAESYGQCDFCTKTRLELRLAKKKDEYEEATKAVTAAGKYLRNVMDETSRAVMQQVMKDKEEYDSSLQRMIDDDSLSWLAFLTETETAANKGPLDMDEVVQVSHDGKMMPAKVIRKLSGTDEYEVSVWREVDIISQQYEEGFETRIPLHCVLPRCKIFKRDKGLQSLGDQDGKWSPTSVEYLVLLYRMAEEAWGRLHHLKTRMLQIISSSPSEESEVHATIPPLKGMQRAIAKALERYDGDFRRLTDLARMTFQCPTIGTALSCFRALLHDPDFSLISIKNRLRQDFDTADTGGYRDLLMNFRCNANGHIVEIQLTLSPLLAVKQLGGHATYVLNRTLGLLKPGNLHYVGRLSDELLRDISNGRVHIVEASGPCGLSLHLSGLAQALRSPYCMLQKINITGGDWPPNESADALLNALCQCGMRLLHVSLDGMKAMHGTLPDEFFERLPCLQYLSLDNSSIAGTLPISLKQCTELKVLLFWAMNWEGELPVGLRELRKMQMLNLSQNQLSGCIPSELGELVSLQKLHLQTNRLSGSIPSDLGRLTNLQELHISRNQLSGSIPVELGKLVNLQELGLYKNQLSGGIPGDLGQLVNLKKLYLSQNKLSGCIPNELGLLANLQKLYLFGNQLSGNIPGELGQLTNLQVLYLSQNKLSGSIPSEFRKLVNLRELYLSQNKLSGDIPNELGRLVNLQKLHLQTNQLSGGFPSELGQLFSMQELHLQTNQLSGIVPSELGQLVNLQKLHLFGNQLSGSIPVELGQLVNLKELYLSQNQLDGCIPGELGKLVNLRKLYLLGNWLSGSIPRELGLLVNMKKLHLSHNRLSGSIPGELGQLIKLQELGLHANYLSGGIPSELGQLVNLQTLGLHTNQLNGSIPGELGQLSNLQDLFLNANQLTGSIPSELGQLINLQKLNLSGNQLSGSIPGELGQLTNLQELYLSRNELNGSIPGGLGQLSNLVVLRLDTNQLRGSIPSELGQLVNLQKLYLSRNQLSGGIPDELGHLVNLTELFLDGNQLSGSIPSELGQLVSLQELCLEENQLSGDIPHELEQLVSLQDFPLGSYDSMC